MQFSFFISSAYVLMVEVFSCPHAQDMSFLNELFAKGS